MHTRYSGTNTRRKLIKSAFGVSTQALTTGFNLGGDLLQVCHSWAELTLGAQQGDFYLSLRIKKKRKLKKDLTFKFDS